jgi:hypothetical protein
MKLCKKNLLLGNELVRKKSLKLKKKSKLKKKKENLKCNKNSWIKKKINSNKKTLMELKFEKRISILINKLKILKMSISIQ